MTRPVARKSRCIAGLPERADHCARRPLRAASGAAATEGTGRGAGQRNAAGRLSDSTAFRLTLRLTFQSWNASGKVNGSVTLSSLSVSLASEVVGPGIARCSIMTRIGQSTGRPWAGGSDGARLPRPLPLAVRCYPCRGDMLLAGLEQGC